MITPTGSNLILVDSSGWIEYFGEGPKADAFGTYLEQEENLLVPSIVIYEVFKKLLLTASLTIAQRFLSHALRALQATLEESLAIEAAKVSVDHKLGMADAIIYATAQANGAQLITGDVDFRGLPGVIIP